VRFGLVHRVSTDTLAVLAVMAVATSGLVSAVTSVALAVGLGVALAVRRGARYDGLILAGSLVAFVASTLLGGSVSCLACLTGACLIAPGALIVSLLRREVEGNYRQGARDRAGSPVDVPRILRSRRVVGRGFPALAAALGASVIVVGVLVFLVLPRPPAPTLRLVEEGVDLTAPGAELSDEIVARVRIDGTAPPPSGRAALRLRASVLDAFDGRSFERAPDGQRDAARGPARGGARRRASGAIALRRPAAPGDRRVRIEREALRPDLVLVPEGAVAIDAPFAVAIAPDGEILGGDGAASYDAFVPREPRDVPEPLGARERARDLALPSSVSPRVRAQGRAWSADAASDAAKARAIERRLRTDFAYDLRSPSRAAASPIDDLLFASKRAHCALFAAAMAIMLRDQGVPARVVTGFFGGSYNPYGGYVVVRARDAHAWVEAYVGGAWRTYDPTPAGPAPPVERGLWHEASALADAASHRFASDVLRYGGPTLSTILSRPPGASLLALGIAAACAALLVCVRVVRPRRRRAGRPGGAKGAARLVAATLYADLEAALAANGIGRAPATPPLALAKSLVATGHPLGTEVLALTNVYLEARYGGAALSREAKVDFARRVRGIALAAAASGAPTGAGASAGAPSSV
jgi:transglutaminase-like putative cysteine protease